MRAWYVRMYAVTDGTEPYCGPHSDGALLEIWLDDHTVEVRPHALPNRKKNE